MIRFAVGPTPLGFAFVARTDLGVCALFPLEDADPSPALARVREANPAVVLGEDGVALAPILHRVRIWIDGDCDRDDIPLDLRGTPFQRQVWEALRTIPRGSTRSYGEIASQVGAPKAARAVGAACGRNPVALLVPCHRVVGCRGEVGGYYWGIERKRALLERERRAAS
jgi:AraC family transcriptional regulator, regulatory protein of adaptative response / methylated-DNA-[protein]-cysteine methyltransferase